jgi:hypothetical protein
MIELAPKSNTMMTYDEAILYCQFLEHNGHNDWRMPTKAESDSTEKIWGWFQGRSVIPGHKAVVQPVRDV